MFFFFLSRRALLLGRPQNSVSLIPMPVVTGPAGWGIVLKVTDIHMLQARRWRPSRDLVVTN